ncbi:MAG: ComF family protein [Massilia sp.]
MAAFEWTAFAWTRLAQGIGALLPSCCALCGKVCAGVVCAPCQGDVVHQRPRCRRCANPVAPFEAASGRPCGACLAALPAFDATVAAIDYATPLDQLLLQLKFGGRLQLAPWFAQLLRDAVLRQAGPTVLLPDLLAPVPLGRRRLAERGFNQALEVARPLSRMLGVPLACQLAMRVTETAPQSSVAPSARAANVRGAFALAAGTASVAGLHVGIVDDVMTSGRTLDALAKTLKAAGAARVSNFVVARTPPG